MSTQYERVEDIPPETCYSFTDRGELHMMFSGNPDSWITADLSALNVTANTDNNR